METFELIKKINGKQVAICELSEEEFILLREGLYYAKIRDCITKRRAAYHRLISKLPHR
jgi:hypothetical protein